VVAEIATSALVSLSAGALSAGMLEPVRLDVVCLAFTIGVSLLTALVFGLVPAWQASHVDPQAAMRERSRTASADRRQHRTRAALVVTEVALAVVLLVGAGLLLRTFSNLVNVNLGFQPAQAFGMNLFLGLRPPEERVRVIEQILERVEAVPGVLAAGTIQFLPLAGMTCGTGVWLDGNPGADATTAAPTECSLVSRGYFAAMGIPVIDGRAFDTRDRFGGPRVLMVNQSFVRRYFPDGRALGRRLFVQGSNQAVAEVIGVVGDVRHKGLSSAPAPTVFLLHAQTPGYVMSLVVRSPAELSGQAAAIRRAIHDADPRQAVAEAKPLEQYVADALARPKMYAMLVVCFAVVAMLLAAVGVYGLVAYVVNQRTHEIGIRLALGASTTRVFRELVAQGGQLIGAGLAIGILGAVLLRNTASGLLFGVAPGDPLTYAAAAAIFAALSAAAAAIPARRASRVDPTTALRHE
jgi:predicted permease